MQDKYTNKEMIDKGWQNMHQILDQEMPIASKGRRVLWYWLFPLLMIGVLSASYAFYHFQKQAEEPIKVKTAIPMAQVDPTERMDLALPAIADKAELSDADQQKNVQNEKSTLVGKEMRPLAKESTASYSVATVEQNSKTHINTVKANKEMTLAPSEIMVQDVAKHESKISSQMRDVASIIVPPTFTGEVRNSYVTNALSTIDRLDQFVRDNLEDRLELEALNQSVLVAKSKSRFSLAATGMMRLNGDIGLRGVGGGLELGYQLTPSVKLFTGAQYDFQKEGNIADFALVSKRSADLVALEEVYTDPLGSVYIDGDKNIAAVSDAIVNSEIRSLSRTFHYLHIPIGAEVQVLRKFSVRMGGRFTYLLSAPSVIPVEFTDFTTAFNSVSKAHRNTLLESGFIRNLDYAATLGVSFYMNRRLSIDASYDHGFTPIYAGADNEVILSNAGYNRSTTKDFNRLFTLGLRYSFSRL